MACQRIFFIDLPIATDFPPTPLLPPSQSLSRLSSPRIAHFRLPISSEPPRSTDTARVSLKSGLGLRAPSRHTASQVAKGRVQGGRHESGGTPESGAKLRIECVRNSRTCLPLPTQQVPLLRSLAPPPLTPKLQSIMERDRLSHEPVC